MTRSGVVVGGYTLGLLLVLGWASVGQANEPALRFTSSTEFQVHPNLQLWPAGHMPRSEFDGIKHQIFARLTAAQAATHPLTFTVEGQSGAADHHLWAGVDASGLSRFTAGAWA